MTRDEYRRLAGITDERVLDERVKERPGTKMVFGKLRKLKKGFEKNASKSDKQMDKIHQTTDKLADIAAKHGGGFGQAASSIYRQQKAATHAGRGLRDLALGRKGASKHFKKAGAELKTGIKQGLAGAARIAAGGK